MMRATLALALASCATDIGTTALVFECDTGHDQWTRHMLLCWDGAAPDLEDSLAEFHPAPRVCRATPAPCLYTCPEDHGCAAQHGCWCP